MLMATKTSDSALNDDAGGRLGGLFEDFDDGGDFSMDVDSFYEILKEGAPDPLQSNSPYLSTEIVNEGGSGISIRDCDESMYRNDTSCCPPTDEVNLTFGGGISNEHSNETMEGIRKHPCTSPAEISLAEANDVSRSGSSSESRISHVPESDYIAAMLQSWREDCKTDYFMNQTLPTSGKMMNYVNNEIDNFQPLFSYLDHVLPETQLQSTDTFVSDVPTIDFLSQKAVVQDFEKSDFVDPGGIDFVSGNSTSIHAVSGQFMLETQVGKMDETSLEIPFFSAMNYGLFEEDENKGVSREVSFAYGDGNLAEMSIYAANESLAVIKKEEQKVVASNMANHPLDLKHKSMHLDLGHSGKSFPVIQPLDSCNSSFVKKELDAKSRPMIVKSASLTLHPTASQVSSPNCRNDGDDDDLCILEDISQPAQMVASLSRQPSTAALYDRTPCTPQEDVGFGGPRLKSNDERSIFQVALQDLHQPNSEANPPDGSLAVPLLRHQRIALSWMVQKETTGWPCSGGILADDQGLGKTVSTIALILTEKPSSGRMPVDIGKVKPETLDLDEDDDKAPKSDILKKNGTALLKNENQMKSDDVSSLSKGRPAAGTLIVCPTSVIRQWADELRSKVTSEANISVLVYHGSHRTKDPYEVAKYDIVLTTYSIVSMEVPKQHLNKTDDDDNRRNLESESALHFPVSKKRKYPPSTDKRCLKRGMGDALPESTVHPLARVQWFRVVLDEAQSIKNRKTRVAQACWGLRAKRRWCLSGTPIQNAVDDLYSYFRFLRYDPYAGYQSFCSIIKTPISRSPTKGYRTLQAVLKTVMLRRTKGTLLDGKPVISLPPKSVELKKVEFSKEERDFYSKLEADSRAQFQVYAASGTVQQNYVNILLLLLRLRQACDHPLLVHGYDSSGIWKSSLNEAKKLSLETLHSLLKCLEASLAICGICNDPPEDAVVSICGHVFCNQCICEHLSGYNNQCPAVNCKVHLSASSVFSGAALNCSLSDQTSVVKSASSSGSHGSSNYREIAEPWLQDRSFGSCKIKTALEVLYSLSKAQDSMANTSSTEHNDSGPSSSGSSESHGDIPDLSDDKISDPNAKDKSTVPVVSEKAIVFSQWTRMLDLLEGCLKEYPIQYRRLDGTMSVAARDKAVRDFNTLPEVSVMIMSLKAASLGLNMVAACRVLLLDPWWNPTTEDQAIDRAHRIGQTRPVTVFRLTVKDTVEDRILALQQKKREMVSAAFGEDETGSRQTRLTVEDLNYLFRV